MHCGSSGSTEQTIVTSFLTPIVLSNMVENQSGANIAFAGEFNNSFVTIGGSGATLGMVIFIAFFAKSAQLSALGKAAIVPSFFNINEPILFGMPVVYNPYTAIPFLFGTNGLYVGGIFCNQFKVCQSTDCPSRLANPNWSFRVYWFRWWLACLLYWH